MRPLHALVGIVLFISCSVVVFGIARLSSSSASAEPRDDAVGAYLPTERLAGKEYERLIAAYQDWDYEQLRQHLSLAGNEATSLSFVPKTAAHYPAISRSLKMTKEERSRFETSGVVVLDPMHRHSFGSVYYQIYATDLPVLVTTDSVLHAWHRSYDNLLQELEIATLMPALADLLKECHEQLTQGARGPRVRAMKAAHQDVDLYLTVARNLLAGAGDQGWNGKLIVPSALREDTEATELLEDIKSLKLQVQFPATESTSIYGGERFVDYSQFRPRGHYTKSSQLKNYFRCMMWLGRADCGFHVLPVESDNGNHVDWQRELRDAALLSQLVRDSSNSERLSAISNIIQLLVGQNDNLTVAGMLSLFESEELRTAKQLSDNRALEQFAEAVWKSGLARQRIRSQAIVSDLHNTYKVPPPALFQLFGQRFTADSFVLSHSVFDSIIFKNRKQKRLMPASLDVAAALGNDYAVELLEPDLREWNYSANLLANRDFVEQLKPQFWNDNVYHRWLDALRTLNEQPKSEHAPEVMKGSAWRAKQLQTQLASWSELRHDNVLYVKQSYTAVPGCQYPDGFVEPYPSLYAKLGQMARATAAAVGELKIHSNQGRIQEQQQRRQDRQIGFLHRFAGIMEQLKAIALRELEARPMTEAQRHFIETTIDRRGSLPNGSGAKPRYDGWYCELLYNEDRPASWNPSIVDVHTNPTDHEALHVGVGDVNFVVIAINNQDDVAAYVGPVYSYYEFVRPAEKRLDDQEWQRMIATNELPPRPAWTKSLTTSPTKRTYNGLSVHKQGSKWIVTESIEGRITVSFRADSNDQGLRKLLKELRARGFSDRFGLSLEGVSQQGLQSLVDVEQLAWVDFTRSKIPVKSIEEFRQRRPDVEILPKAFGVAAVAVCEQIDGLRRFKADKSGNLSPGRPLLLYVEPANLTWGYKNFGMRVKLEVNVALIDASGADITQSTVPLEIQVSQPDELIYTKVEMMVPASLKAGVYQLRVELKDALATPPRMATTVISLEY